MRKLLLLVFMAFSILSLDFFPSSGLSLCANTNINHIRTDKKHESTFKSETNSDTIEKESLKQNITNLIKPKFGIYITSLNELNPKEGTFDVIFWTWFVHSTKEYNPDKTVEVTNIKDIQNFYELEAEEKESVEENNSSKIWNTQKFKATIFHNWNLDEYPFDSHKLKIKFEDAEFDYSQLQFSVDKKNSKISQDFKLDGWNVEKLELIEREHELDTSFGDPAIEGTYSSYSEVTAIVSITRDGMRDFVNIFGPIYLAFFLSWLGFFIKEAYDMKVTLFLSSVFMLIANKDIIDSTIPVTSNVTLLDKVQFLTFASVTFFVVVVTVSMHIRDREMFELDDKLYRVSMYFISVIYFFGNLYFFKDIFF